MDPSQIHILLLDRKLGAARAIHHMLTEAGYRVAVATDEVAALHLASGELFNVVVKSFDARQVAPESLMQKLRSQAPDTQFILVAEGSTVEAAVSAIKCGAFDYLTTPLEEGRLLASIAKALEHQSLTAEDQQLKIRLRRRSDPDIFAGGSEVMQAVSRLIAKVSSTDVTVLIEGESGTGKEIIARAIHEKSRRRARPFIAVNCAALPDSLIEAELFGHVRGAFTGAVGDRQGRFRQAHGGTLFLDEIGDLSPKGQGDLLRVLEDGMYRPIGSTKLERADVRIVAATNKRLEEECEKGCFRDDLYYRLNIVTICPPPLRERVQDIPDLVSSFAQHFCAKHQRRPKRFTPEVLALFQALPWPGNVRQLRNLVERLAVTVSQGVIGREQIPEDLVNPGRKRMGFTIQPGMSIAQVESELIRQTLLKCTSNREAAAGILGISRRALQYKIKSYGL
ncbi:sigma-54-dependent transcriptional regulator [Verrucomicrobium spinosum]|uniref:sigma-54-dependent transcriptional regulator n=1 Tax=Verrucomicrobium spinosum TaxID=2736 RepID=UPI0001745698|nr:sigma-54 dependent transcriptional regulator [Verrucomicrobium spinosum]